MLICSFSTVLRYILLHARGTSHRQGICSWPRQLCDCFRWRIDVLGTPVPLRPAHPHNRRPSFHEPPDVLSWSTRFCHFERWQVGSVHHAHGVVLLVRSLSHLSPLFPSSLSSISALCSPSSPSSLSFLSPLPPVTPFPRGESSRLPPLCAHPSLAIFPRPCSPCCIFPQLRILPRTRSLRHCRRGESSMLLCSKACLTRTPIARRRFPPLSSAPRPSRSPGCSTTLFSFLPQSSAPTSSKRGT